MTSPLDPQLRTDKHSSRRTLLLAGCILTLAASPTIAQVGIGGGNYDPRDPEEDPLLLPERRPTQPAATPTTPQPTVQPEPVRGAPALLPSSDVGRPVPGGLLAEGSFLAGALGRPVQGRTGAWYFIFEPDQRGPGGVSLPAMVLMPGPNLASLERAAGRLADSDRLRVTGQVFVYAGLNYVMLMAPPIIETEQSKQPEQPAPTPPAASQPGTQADAPAVTPAPASAEPAQPPADEPSIQQIIEQLDRAVGSSRRVELPPGTRAEAAASDSPPATGLVPGGYLAARRGRLVRGSEGAPMLALDSGASGRTESPMILLPSQNLARMEAVAAAQGDRATFTVSGDVFVFKGQNYLLPRLFIVNRPTDLIASGQ